MDIISGLQRGPQKCLNGTDSEQLNHTRTTHRPSDHNTPHRHKLGKHEWHTVGLSGWPISALQPTPCTHSDVLRRRTLAYVCLLYFRSPAPICSDAHQCLLEHGVSIFFFLLAHQCSQLSSLPAPPSSTFFPRGLCSPLAAAVIITRPLENAQTHIWGRTKAREKFVPVRARRASAAKAETCQLQTHSELWLGAGPHAVTGRKTPVLPDHLEE